MFEKKYLEILKENKVSDTGPRRKIFEALLRASSPVSMNELINSVHSLDRVTVYRAIELFESLKIVKKLQIGWKYKLELGDAFSLHHHHLACLKCGKLVDFDEPEKFDDALKNLEELYGFSVTQHTLELTGLCSVCKLT